MRGEQTSNGEATWSSYSLCCTKHARHALCVTDPNHGLRLRTRIKVTCKHAVLVSLAHCHTNYAQLVRALNSSSLCNP